MLVQTARSVWYIKLFSTGKFIHKNQYRLSGLCHGNVPCNVCLYNGSRECRNVSSDKLPTEIASYLPSFLTPFGGRIFRAISYLNLYAHIYFHNLNCIFQKRWFNSDHRTCRRGPIEVETANLTAIPSPSRWWDARHSSCKMKLHTKTAVNVDDSTSGVGSRTKHQNYKFHFKNDTRKAIQRT